jgi:hypothetical protein|tara:strand:+ start:186 stop:377 length:192 start_codon:yes stop_codon:yes gene_type:complete
MPDITYYATVDDESVCISTMSYLTALNTVPDNYIVIASDEMTTIVGYTYDGGEWIAPPDPEVE